MSSLRNRLAQLSPQPQTSPSIYKVPRQLSDVNSKAYEPEMVAIGPYHHGKDKFKTTEELKLRYFQSLLLRKPEIHVEHYTSAIEEIEKSARECYAELSIIPDSANQFTDMLVLDGCFIIEVITSPQLYKDTFPAKSSFRTLQLDLILLENQIPFFVLSKLFDLIHGPEQHSSLMEHLLDFWDDFCPEEVFHSATNTMSLEEVKHILDLVYNYLCPSKSNHQLVDVPSPTISSVSGLPVIPSVSELKRSNVKFCNKEYDSNTSFYDVEFRKCSGKLVMPTLVVDDNTESLLRNLIAYEQLFPNGKPMYVTDYATLLDCLIDTPKDVQQLSRSKIIRNMMGSDEAVVAFVNRLTENVVIGDENFVYGDMFYNINAHHQKRWNKTVAVFHREYFNSPWAYIAFLGALTLLLLTIAQTIFSALQVWDKEGDD